MKDFLRFRKMLTPLIIEIIFWIGVAGSTLMSLATIIGGLTNRFMGGAAVLTGIIMLFVGPILVRVWCELMLLAFKIYESLRNIEKNMVVEKKAE